MKDDAELLRCYAENHEEAAFTKFVRRRIDLVYSAALRRTSGNAHAAADVTQQVFTAAAMRATALARHPALTGWLYTATRNAAINHMREDKRRRRLEQMAVELDIPSGDQGRWEEIYPVLDGVIDELNGPDREAVLLRFFEGLPFAEMGMRLQVSENGARMRVERALDKLRSRLVRHGIVTTAGALGTTLGVNAMSVAPAELTASVAAGAVSGAAATSAIAAVSGTIILMSINKLILGLAALLAAIGIGGAFYEARNATRAENELSALTHSREGDNLKAEALSARLRVADQNAAIAARQIAALQADLEAARKTAGSDGTRKVARINPEENPWANPNYARLWLEKYQKSIGLDYGPLYRALNFSPEQVAKFETVLMEAQQGIVDIWTEAARRNIPTDPGTPSSTSVARLTSGPLGAMQDDLKALLGDAGFVQYQQYEEAKSSRNFVTSLAGGLYDSEAPLTTQQGDILVQILAANTKTVRTPMADDGKGSISVLTKETDWASAENQAQGLLSPSQFAKFHAMAEQQQTERELNATLGSPSSNTGPNP